MEAKLVGESTKKLNYSAPRYLNEFLSSLTAVLTSSKVSADTAHRACFCASAIAWSSADTEFICPDAGAGAGGTGGACAG